MYKIEFNDDMTFDSIIESFNNLQEAEIESFIEIDGVKIYWNDKNRNKKLEEILQKHKSSIKNPNSIDDEKNTNNNIIITPIEEKGEVSKLLNRIQSLYWLSKNSIFTFELGTVLKYTKPEYIDNMIEYYVSVYDATNTSYEKNKLLRNLNYMSELILILKSDSSEIEKGLRIQNIINRIADNEDEKFKFDISIGRIEKYIVDGEKIRELLYLDVLNDKLSTENEELNRQKNKRLF